MQPTESTEGQAAASLEETSQKVKAALLPTIEAHISGEEFSPKDGLDFLDVKNSLLLSYLIELVVHIRDRGEDRASDSSSQRLVEMKTVLDKMRGLDKKLKYQIDKLLAANATATEFASGGDNGNEDPLQFRPNPQSLQDGENSSSDDSDDEGDEGSAQDAEDDDDDLEAAKATLSMAKDKETKTNDESDGIYRAPRLTAMPYAHDQEQKEKEKEKRARRRLRATELAQTLRAEYGEAPEQEDIHGGSEIGRQRAAARRLAEREAEKIRYEEDAMVRLTETRKEKKERKRHMRQEGSNLAAISDLGNLVRETRAFGREEESEDEQVPAPPVENSRYDNGKRRREPKGGERQGRGGRMGKAKNSLQAALFNTEGKYNTEGKQKKKRRK